MGLFKKQEVDFSKELEELYEIEDFWIGTVMYSGEVLIAIVKVKDHIALTKTWKEINSYVTSHYISEDTSEFSKWNFYLFYLVSDKINKPLRYEIENNKFSSRKIVEDEYKLKLDDNNIESIISQHITNSDIQVKIAHKPVTPFSKSENISIIIDDISIPKQGKEEVLIEALKKIEKVLKDEV